MSSNKNISVKLVSLKQLAKSGELQCTDVKRKIFIILDNLAVHRSKKFMKWLEKRRDKIEVFYLLSYSPELNRDLKTHFHSGVIVKNEKELKNKGFLRKLDA